MAFYIYMHTIHHKQHQLRKAHIHYNNVGYLDDDELIEMYTGYYISVNFDQCYSCYDIRNLIILGNEMDNRQLEAPHIESLLASSD